MKRILFVCVENACRSQMAEGFAKAIGRDTVEVYSAGSRPSGVVNARAIQFMREKGIDLSTHASEGLDRVANLAFDHVITMGCGDACPHVPAQARHDWALRDPKHLPDEEFRAVRDDIERRVRALLELP